MPSKLKVLHVIPSIAAIRGGPSKAVIEMVRALRKNDVDASIVTTTDNGDGELDVKTGKLLNYHGVPVHFFKRYSPSINAVREFAYSYDFQRWLKKHIAQYDIIHVHAIFSFCSTYAMYQARKQKIPYIVRPIGQLEHWSLQQSQQRKSLYLKLIEKNNLNSAKNIHFTAESEKKQALDLFPQLNSMVIPLGIDTPELIPNATIRMREHWALNNTDPTIVFLSRLHQKKGIELLLKAVSTLTEIKFQLIIAGDGDLGYTQSLKTMATELGLNTKCQFVGFIEGEEKNLLLQGADLFALTSHSENFGIAALEAMASGTAVVVTNEVALSEHVINHQLGYTTTLKHDDIVSTLKQALSARTITADMGLNARDYVKQHFQWDVIANRIRDHYAR